MENGSSKFKDESELKQLRDNLFSETKTWIDKIWKIISCCLFVDSILFAVFVQASYNTTTLDLLDIFYNHTLDICLSILLRWIIVFMLTYILIKYGHPDRYRNLSLKKCKSKTIKFILLVWKYTLMHSKQCNIIFRETDTFSSKCLEFELGKKQKRQIIGCTDVLNQYQYYNQYEISSFIFDIIWSIIVIIICIFQTYISIKFIFYQGHMTKTMRLSATLCIILGVVEIYLFEKYIKYSIETYYKYKNIALHEHWLKSTMNAGAWCDVCWLRGYIDCFRCDLCDFDICYSCWQKIQLHELLQIINLEMMKVLYIKKNILKSLVQFTRTHPLINNIMQDMTSQLSFFHYLQIKSQQYMYHSNKLILCILML